MSDKINERKVEEASLDKPLQEINKGVSLELRKEEEKTKSVIGRIIERVKFHFVDVRVGAIVDAVKASNYSGNIEILDMSGFDNLGVAAAELFVKERCVRALFPNLKFFPVNIHGEIAEMLIRNGHGIAVLENLDYFSGVDKNTVFNLFTEFLTGGGCPKKLNSLSEDLTDLQVILGDDQVYDLIKLMVKKGYGEYILQAFDQGMQINKYSQEEIVELHIKFLNEKVSVLDTPHVAQLLRALKGAKIIFPEKESE
jgi:hypothetical protein